MNKNQHSAVQPSKHHVNILWPSCIYVLNLNGLAQTQQWAHHKELGLGRFNRRQTPDLELKEANLGPCTLYSESFLQQAQPFKRSGCSLRLYGVPGPTSFGVRSSSRLSGLRQVRCIKLSWLTSAQLIYLQKSMWTIALIPLVYAFSSGTWGDLRERW